MDFIHFWSIKIRDSPTGIVSSLSPPSCHLHSDRCHHAAMLCHASFPLSKDELAANASSYSNDLSCRIPSQSKTETLNSHHRHRLPFPDHPTPTIHLYKNIISTLTTLSTTQLRLHFASSLSRTPCEWSFDGVVIWLWRRQNIYVIEWWWEWARLRWFFYNREGGSRTV
jgi:hypothetical protein